jgi:hypothetical protein
MSLTQALRNKIKIAHTAEETGEAPFTYNRNRKTRNRNRETGEAKILLLSQRPKPLLSDPNQEQNQHGTHMIQIQIFH